ncbi:MAG: lysophospholipid acyltransferase family protein [Acidobacteriota bacterium]|nr:lysophospholipid acyltransferase family protein [Acidobacteriota bacterium]
MAPDFRKLTLADLILNRKESFTFRIILAAFGIALRLFFRRIETVNADVVPKNGGLIFVLNHPNGLIDAAMVFVAMPRKISFLAKSTLFQMPVISFLLRTVAALPLYRRIDTGEDVSKNQKTFEACRELLQNGGSIAMFPEGVSHNSPKLLPAKTGAARIALGTTSVIGEVPPVEVEIVPVGLFYTNKTNFRSEALLHFGEPFHVVPVAPDADGEPPRVAVNELTEKIENALREVTLNAETDAELHTAAVAERIFSSAMENENLGEKFEFLQKFVVGNTGTNEMLETRLHAYDLKLGDHGIEPEHLSLAQFSRRVVVKQAVIQTWVLIMLLPLSIPGTILHFPAYNLCDIFSRIYARHGADDVASTVKVLAGMLFMPLTWLVIAAALYFFFGWKTALISIPVSVICGYAALYSLEEMAELRGWAKAIWLFLTKREVFLRMFVERRELQVQLQEFGTQAASFPVGPQAPSLQ